MINNGKISIYNRTTFDDNQYYPGVLITASEVNSLLAEYCLKTNGHSDPNAKNYEQVAAKDNLNTKIFRNLNYKFFRYVSERMLRIVPGSLF